MKSATQSPSLPSLMALVLAASSMVVALGGASRGALADEANQRLENQQNRIDQGVQNGSLSNGEAKHLENQQNRIQNTVNRDEAKNGGTLTPAEQRRINRRENRSSRNVYRKKHNAKTQ